MTSFGGKTICATQSQSIPDSNRLVQPSNKECPKGYNLCGGDYNTLVNQGFAPENFVCTKNQDHCPVTNIRLDQSGVPC